MQIYGRSSLVPNDSPASEPALLLEGEWPNADMNGRWSLDQAIDSRHEWIDRQASQIAAVLGGEGRVRPAESPYDLPLFANLNARELRYYLVKLLRLQAFFDHVWRGPRPEHICLHVARKRDSDYASLIKRLAADWGVPVQVHWRRTSDQLQPTFPRNRLWRRAISGILSRLEASTAIGDGAVPRVVLCGNRKFLDPICEELLSRGIRVWWLYDRFAVGTWLRWRRHGVGQLVCDASEGKVNLFANVHRQLTSEAFGPLTPALARWLRTKATNHGARQTRLMDQVADHFDRIRPNLLIVDEDATPLPRAAIVASRARGAASIVVQHGAPYVRFGFAPLAADQICVWGAASKQRLRDWGVDAPRINITGPVGLGGVKPFRPAAVQLNSPVSAESTPALPRSRVGLPCRAASVQILLLATTPARDDRPDAVEFHLTRASYAEMLRMALACAARMNAKLTIKLHPRSPDGSSVTELLQRFPTVPAKVVRRGRLERLIRQADCVLSCASSSGVEAAAAGAVVIQLLPQGSGEMLSARDWGFAGTARTEHELDSLLAAQTWQKQHDPAGLEPIFADPSQSTAKVVDSALEILMRGGREDRLLTQDNSSRSPASEAAARDLEPAA